MSQNMFNHSQNGAVLIAGLMILIILTIMGIATMNSSLLSEKMTANFRDELIAFQGAESGLIDAENWLTSLPQRPEGISACLSPPCLLWNADIQKDLEKKSASFWTTQGKPFSGDLKGSANQPYYLISEEMFVPFEMSPEAAAKGKGYQFYKITARGTGNTKQAQVFVESIYAINYN